MIHTYRISILNLTTTLGTTTDQNAKLKLISRAALCGMDLAIGCQTRDCRPCDACARSSGDAHYHYQSFKLLISEADICTFFFAIQTVWQA